MWLDFWEKFDLALGGQNDIGTSRSNSTDPVRRECIGLNVDRLVFPPSPETTHVEYFLFADLRHRDAQANLHRRGFILQYRGLDRSNCDTLHRAVARPELPKVVAIKSSNVMEYCNDGRPPTCSLDRPSFPDCRD